MNRRRFSRWLCSSMVTVSVNEGNFEQCHDGIVEDVSRNGLCVVTDSGVRPGTRVVVSQRTERFAAVVRHCETDHFNSWRIGLEFVDGYQWSESEAWAEHLLNPAALDR